MTLVFVKLIINIWRSVPQEKTDRKKRPVYGVGRYTQSLINEPPFHDTAATTNLQTGSCISWSTSPRYNPASLSADSTLFRASNLFIPCTMPVLKVNCVCAMEMQTKTSQPTFCSPSSANSSYKNNYRKQLKQSSCQLDAFLVQVNSVETVKANTEPTYYHTLNARKTKTAHTHLHTRNFQWLFSRWNWARWLFISFSSCSRQVHPLKQTRTLSQNFSNTPNTIRPHTSSIGVSLLPTNGENLVKITQGIRPCNLLPLQSKKPQNNVEQCLIQSASSLHTACPNRVTIPLEITNLTSSMSKQFSQFATFCLSFKVNAYSHLIKLTSTLSNSQIAIQSVTATDCTAY